VGNVSKGLFAYSAGIFGGAGQGQARTGNNSAYAIRAAFNPLGAMPYTESALENFENLRFSIGGDYFWNTLKKTGPTTFQTLPPHPPYVGQTGGWGERHSLRQHREGRRQDVQHRRALKWRGLSAQAEYMHGSADGEVTGRKVDAAGMYAQAGYLVVRNTLKLRAAIPGTIRTTASPTIS